jgi:hypothetical protein
MGGTRKEPVQLAALPGGLAALNRIDGCGWWWLPPTRQAAGHSTWYLLTDLPRPTGRRAQAVELAEVVRLYGLRNWVEPGYKQAKDERGWADLQVPLDRVIRRPGRGSAARFVLLAGIARRAAAQPVTSSSQAAA